MGSAVSGLDKGEYSRLRDIERTIEQRIRAYTILGGSSELIAQGVTAEFEVSIISRFLWFKVERNIDALDELYQAVLDLRENRTTLESGWFIAGEPLGFRADMRFPWYKFRGALSRKLISFRMSRVVFSYDYKNEPFPFGEQISEAAALMELAYSEVPTENLPKWLLQRASMSRLDDTM